MSKPLAVVISDVHYSLQTYHLADKAFRQAVDKAASLGVPLIDCGDLTSDKAILRAEYTNALIKTMEYAQDKLVSIYCLVGNHSLLNEKGTDHALHFLRPYASIISSPVSTGEFNFIPYQSSSDKFLQSLGNFSKGSIVFGHQGTIGGQLGDYVKDSTAFDPSLTLNWKVFLGHYHAHYSLKNTVSIGNPYTLTFGEANDPDKGFLVVNQDGSFHRVMTGLRRHTVVEVDFSNLQKLKNYSANTDQDLIWIKLSGTQDQLSRVDVDQISKYLKIKDFRLDLIHTDAPKLECRSDTMSQSEIMDSIVDATDENEDQKSYLKTLWREISQ